MPPSIPVSGDLRNRNGGGSERGQKENQQPRVAEEKPRQGVSWIWAVLSLIAIVIVVGVILYVLPRRVAPPVCYPESRDETCYEGKKDVYRMYGTKTDYRVLVSMFELDKQKEYVVPGCTPRGLFLFNRHTTRFPDRDDIVKMVDALPRLQSSLLVAARNNTVHLCKSDIDALSNWTLRLRPEDDNHVTPSGRNVSCDQAKRFLAMFPKIFSPFRASDYVVGFTSRVRTNETAQAFLRGLLSPTEYSEVERNFLPPQDDILEFHKECDQISKQDKAGTPEAVEAFEKGPYWKRLLDTLSWRLGFAVTKADLKMLLRACQFEFAIVDTSPWCAVFTEDDLKAVEFREDLDDYYKDGYGRERNYAQACPVIKELISRLEEMSNDTSKPNKVLFFSHAGGFKKVVARLGLHRDSKAPTADGLCTQADRQWRSSLLCPFNANLVFVLFNCTNNQHEVVTLLNEQPQQLPGCPSHRCPLETFVNTYKGYVDSCNLTQICTGV